MLLTHRVNLNLKYYLMYKQVSKKITYRNLKNIKYKDLEVLYSKYKKSYVDDYVFNCFAKYFNINKNYNSKRLKDISKIINTLKIDLDYYSYENIIKLYENQFNKIRPLKTQIGNFQKLKMEKIYFQFLKSRLTIISRNNKYKLLRPPSWFGNIYITNKRIVFVNDQVEKSIFLNNQIKNKIDIKKHRVIIESTSNINNKYILIVHNYESLIIALKRIHKF